MNQQQSRIFKSLDFKNGLNILLADKSEGATERQPRNGAGKTSLIKLVHFLTGGQVGKGNIFRSEALRENTFNILMDVGNDEVMVERTGSSPAQVRVDRRGGGGGGNWRISQDQEKLPFTALLTRNATEPATGCPESPSRLPGTGEVERHCLPLHNINAGSCTLYPETSSPESPAKRLPPNS